MKRNLAVFGFAILSLYAPGSAIAELQTPSQPVHASEPTVMTVHGVQSRVQEKKVVKPQRRAGKALRGIMSFPGWALNASDDIPSPRERQIRTAAPESSSFSALPR